MEKIGRILSFLGMEEEEEDGVLLLPVSDLYNLCTALSR